jgi:hypothetical protein
MAGAYGPDDGSAEQTSLDAATSPCPHIRRQRWRPFDEGAPIQARRLGEFDPARHIWQAGLPAQQRVLRSDIAFQWSRRSLTSLVGSDAANIGFWGQPQRLARRRQYPWFSQRHLSRWHMPSRPGRRRL